VPSNGFLEGTAITIALTGAGSLGVRLGHYFGRLGDVTSLRGGTATTNVIAGANMPTAFNTLAADLAAGTALKQLGDTLYTSDLAAFQTAQTQLFQNFQTRCSNILKAMVSIDGYEVSASAPPAQLTQISLTTSLSYLFNQMNSNTTTFNASVPAVGAQTAVGTPQGNAVVVGSVKNPQGVTLQYVFPETVSFVCTNDSQSGGATSGNEPLSVTGQQAVADVFSPLWPGGSGAASTIQAVDGSKSNATGNLLQNSDFATATTANNPDNWTLVTGVAGTDIFNGTGANAYTTGGGSLVFTGTAGAVKDCATQSFNTAPTVTVGAGGTAAALRPDAVYQGNCWIKGSNTFAAGALEFALTDGTAGIGTIMNDDAGTPNSTTFTLTSGGISLGTVFTPVNFTFRTPAVLPATTPYRLRVRAATALTNGVSLYIGRLALAAPAAPFYAGGPYFSVFSGNTRMIAGLTPDTWTVGVTNTYSLWASWMQRIFNMNGLGLTAPNTTSSPTLADTLIA
jgi:hypothetical protein